MYSFVNAAVVARDLSRHDYGGALAADLLHGLALDENALAVLDGLPAVTDASERRQALDQGVAAEATALQVMSAVRQAADDSGLSAWMSSLGLLEAAPMGGWDELRRWVRGELLADAWDRVGDVAVARWPHALDVVTDGLLVTYVGSADPSVAAPLARPWRSWTRRRAAASLAEPAVAEVVAMLAAASPESVAAAGAAMQQARAAGWSWALAMHDACWAVELTGRSRTSCIAQVEAVRALLAVTGPRPRPDVVAAVTAAVQATVAADVLASETVAAMCRPLLANLS